MEIAKDIVLSFCTMGYSRNWGRFEGKLMWLAGNLELGKPIHDTCLEDAGLWLDPYLTTSKV